MAHGRAVLYSGGVLENFPATRPCWTRGGVLNPGQTLAALLLYHVLFVLAFVLVLEVFASYFQCAL